ncbi:MAG: hypothetical protein QXY62_02705 [Candidatus Altiarchaeota archaeon]
MKILNKKSQAAVEYLQTYGWVMIIIAIIGVTLWYLGVFSNRQEVNIATGFSKIKVPEATIQYRANIAGNALNFTIVNGVGDFIRISSMIAKGDCNGAISYGIEGLEAGEARNVGAQNCNSLYRGENFEVAVNITYSTKLGSQRITRTEYGIIRGVAE